MSEETKLLPCAWCQKEPNNGVARSSLGGSDFIYKCVFPDCVVSHSSWETQTHWNDRQRAILARRKADFEAGERAGKGNGPSDFEAWIAS